MEDTFTLIEIKWNSKSKMGIIHDYKLVEQMREKYKIICEPINNTENVSLADENHENQNIIYNQQSKKCY